MTRERRAVFLTAVCLSLACTHGGASGSSDGGPEVPPGATGHTCSGNSDCNSGICLPLSNGHSVCTTSCLNTNGCVQGWTCSTLAGQATNVCQCSPQAESCDGRDDDCDGLIDDGPAPDEQCAKENGTGWICQQAQCAKAPLGGVDGSKAGDGGTPMAIGVKLSTITRSCDMTDAFQNVDKVAIGVYAPDLDSASYAKNIPVSELPNTVLTLPSGKARNFVVEGYQSGSPADTLVARGESGPIDLEMAAPSSITIFIHPVDSFSHVTSSDPSASNVCTALTQGRAAHTATVLENGKVLIAGGYDPTTNPPTYLNSTEILDPTTGTLIVGPRLGVARAYHTATHIPGTPLTVIAGGEGKNQTAISVAEIYDESQNTFSAVGLSAKNGRTRHTAVLAPTVTGGVQVLLIGGYANSDAMTATNPLYSGEAFDATSGSFSQAFTFPNNAGLAEAAAIVYQGRVLVEGGWTGTAPNMAGFFLAPNASGGCDVRSAPSISAPHLVPLLAPLGDGITVMLAGGFVARSTTGGVSSLSGPSVVTEFLNGTAMFTKPAGLQLSQAAGGADAVSLPNGTVLVAGGEYTNSMATVSSVSADLFMLDPNASTPTLTKQKPSPGALKEPRFLPRLTLLPDGRVLVSGGADYTSDGHVALVTKLEIYEPQYVASGNNPHSMP